MGRKMRHKGVRSSHLKRYYGDYIRVAPKANVEVLAEYKARADSANTQVRESEFWKWVDRLYPGRVNAIRKQANGYQFELIAQMPRALALARIWQELKDADLENHVTLKLGTMSYLKMFWSRDRTRFWFMRRVGDVYEKSVDFTSRKQAMLYHDMGRYAWREIQLPD